MSLSFCVSTFEWDEFSVLKDDSVTSGFDSKWLLLFFITFEGTITIISEDSIQHIEPTLMYGNMKPPIVYNQAPKAGPKIIFWNANQFIAEVNLKCDFHSLLAKMKLYKMCYTVGLDDLPTAYPNTLHEPTKDLILCC